MDASWVRGRGPGRPRDARRGVRPVGLVEDDVREVLAGDRYTEFVTGALEAGASGMPPMPSIAAS
jgi:hypothetical protein